MATQYLIYFVLLRGILEMDAQGKAFPLFSSTIILLIIVKFLIVAAGNIVNDIYDYGIDQINKPDKVFINNIITKRGAWLLYFALNIAAIAVSFLLYRTETHEWRWLYPVGLTGLIVGLWAYSAFFKSSPLVGNLMVAFFVTFAPYFVLLPIIHQPTNAPETSYAQLLSTAQSLGWFYIVFAFLTTLTREIIKDLEDMEGDARFGARTLPIVIGIPKTKIFLLIVMIIFLISLIIYANQWLLNGQYWLSLVFMIMLLILPTLWIAYSITGARTKADFHKISSLMKLLMLMGLVFLIIFYLNVL